MAKQRNSKPPRRRDKPGAGGGRRKPCLFCKDKVEYADYKDVATLGRYTSERGRIRARRITGLCRRHQSQVATAVKRARELALLPYIAESSGDDRPDRRGRGRDRDRER
jgi:small subunit ribosomal protein S18